MDGTCKYCRFWKPPNADDGINVGECQCPKIAFGCTNYEDDEVVVVNRGDSGEPFEPDEAAVEDGSGYKASFHPGPNFGCIHWQGG